MVGLYMDAAATDCDARKTQDTGHHRPNRFIDPGHEIEKTIQQGRDWIIKESFCIKNTSRFCCLFFAEIII